MRWFRNARRNRIARLTVLGATAAVTLLAAAAAVPLQVDNAWVQAAPPGAPALAAYLRLRNVGAEPIVVERVESPQFVGAEVHETVIENGVARMVARPELDIAPGAELEFAPGGLHVMLIDPRKPVREGDTVEIRWFLRGGIEVVSHLEVRRAVGGEDAPMHHHHDQ